MVRLTCLICLANHRQCQGSSLIPHLRSGQVEKGPHRPDVRRQENLPGLCGLAHNIRRSLKIVSAIEEKKECYNENEKRNIL